MATRKLLLVDDDTITRRALARTLADPDFDILQADSPTQGLAMLAANEDIKVVISDFHMGRETGAGFLSVVERKYPNVVRILLTSDTSTNVFVAGVNEGHARRVLYKPWSGDQVISLVRHSFGLPRRATKAYEVKPPTQRTLTRLAALLGVDRIE